MTAFNASIGYVTLDPLQDGKRFRLVEAVCYDYGDRHYVVPKGFTTDFASIPGIGRIFLPRWGLYGWGAILHDYLYAKNGPIGVSRKEADRMFLVFMKLRDTPIWQMLTIYYSVRLFGWMFFRKTNK